MGLAGAKRIILEGGSVIVTGLNPDRIDRSRRAFGDRGDSVRVIDNGCFRPGVVNHMGELPFAVGCICRDDDEPHPQTSDITRDEIS